MRRTAAQQFVNNLKQHQQHSLFAEPRSSFSPTTTTTLTTIARPYSIYRPSNTLAKTTTISQSYHHYSPPLLTVTRDSTRFHRSHTTTTTTTLTSTRTQRFSSTQQSPPLPQQQPLHPASASPIAAEAIESSSTTTRQTLASTPNNTTIQPLSSQSTAAPTQEAVSSEMTQQLPTSFPKFTSFDQFYKWYLVDPPFYQRYSSGWWMSNSWLMLMYSVTGYSALIIVRKVLSLFGIQNVGLFKGDWQHRLLYFLMMTPTYSLMTLLYGYVFGRPVYGATMVRRIWSRFFPWLKNKQKSQ